MSLESGSERDITIHLGLFRWEPSTEEDGLEFVARRACLDDRFDGQVPDDFLVAQRIPNIRRAMNEHCDFLERLWDNLAYDTGYTGFRIQSKVRFWNVWLGFPAMAAPDARLVKRKDEVEVTVFTGRKKLFGHEVATRFLAPLGSHGVTQQDEERLEAAISVAVERIRAASTSGEDKKRQ